MANDQVVCCINVDGKPRELFTLEDREQDGDLYIYIPAAVLSRDLGTTITDNQPPIKTQKISVHRSLDSPHNINVIKLTRIFADDTERSERHVTRAIKAKNAWVPLFCSRRANMSHDSYLVSPKAKDTWPLGSFDTSKFTLLFSIVVSHRDLIYRPPLRSNTNCQTRRFQHFSITVLWSFVSVPSPQSAMTAFLFTLSPTLIPEHMRPMFDGMYDGLSAAATATQVTAHFNGMLQELGQTLSVQIPECRDVWQTGLLLGLFRDGNNFKEVSKRMAKLTMPNRSSRRNL
jgi:hypothetical protein